MDKRLTNGRLKHAKRAGSHDTSIGSRVRLARALREVSQEELGRQLGISFQQVQKYELGANRISASRLFVIAGILAQPIAFFFEGWDELVQEPAPRPQPVRPKKGGPSRQQIVKVLQQLLAEETADK